MTFTFEHADSVSQQVQRVLEALQAGAAPRDIERAQVDIKEEPGRRGPAGVVLAGRTENDGAARYLAGELACLANTPGGGALVVGVADDGTRIGTELSADWLRHRIWELTTRQLTISAQMVQCSGVRLLVLVAPEAIEPIRYAGRLRWRLDDHCVDMDPTSWHVEARRRAGIDWSAEPSEHTLDDVSAVAAEIARRYLRAAANAGDDAAAELAEATIADLLRRLHVIDGRGRLSNAGSLLFVRTPDIGIDYLRREVAGGDSITRVRSNRALLEQVAEVEMATDVTNRIVHVGASFAHGLLRAIPQRALREAVMNGIVHRDWLSRQPTLVEHIGDRLTVTSPGGFIGGIAAANIITHPAVPRYRSLAEAVASLRLAEREGIGIDRIVRDLLARGHRAPDIAEIAGPYVRITLAGGDPDATVMALLSSLQPPAAASDVDMLLVIGHLLQTGWIDVEHAAPVIQRSRVETEEAMSRIAAVTVDGDPVVVPINGVPAGAPVAYRFSERARTLLDTKMAHLATPDGRRAMIVSWAHARSRVSSTEVADFTGLSVPYAGTLLKALADESLLRPARANRMGRGFYYLPVRDHDDHT